MHVFCIPVCFCVLVCLCVVSCMTACLPGCIKMDHSGDNENYFLFFIHSKKFVHKRPFFENYHYFQDSHSNDQHDVCVFA